MGRRRSSTDDGVTRTKGVGIEVGSCSKGSQFMQADLRLLACLCGGGGKVQRIMCNIVDAALQSCRFEPIGNRENRLHRNPVLEVAQSFLL